MITSAGKDVINNFFGGQVGRIAGSIAVGVGATAESLSDARLTYEVARVPVTTVASDLANNRVVYKANLSPGVLSSAYEVGIYSGGLATTDIDLHVIPSSADWTNAAVVSSNSRIGVSSVHVSASPSTTTTASLPYPATDASAQNNVVVAFTTGANLSSVKLRLGTDSSNYREFTLASTPGYNIVRLALSSGTTTGTFNASAISYIALVVTAASLGTTDVYLDGIKLEQTANNDTLVARYVPGTPNSVDINVASEVEYSLVISA